MRLQVLVSTMHQTDHSLLDRMHLQSDAIVVNQCDRNEIEQVAYKGHTVRWLSLAERGVGLSRNTALQRADADIVLFADDDVVYADGYEDVITRYYASHPEADVVIFNMKVRRLATEDLKEIVSRSGRISRRQATPYGTFCVTAKTQSIRMANIGFHLLFGGGTVHSCGEDTIFLQDCFKKGLCVHTSTDLIGNVTHGESTWFQGYTEKYFADKGALFRHLYPKFYRLIALYHVLKHRKLYEEYGCRNALKTMLTAKNTQQ